MKKTELRVNIHGEKSKTEVLKAVTKLTGVNEISVDGEKGTITVIGDVDPVKLAKQIRKCGRSAEIISVGPPKKPENKPDEKKPPPPPPPPPPCYCNECQLVAVSYAAAVPYAPYDGGVCSIL